MLEKLKQMRLEQRFNFFHTPVETDSTNAQATLLPEKHWLIRGFKALNWFFSTDIVKAITTGFLLCLLLGYGDIISFSDLMIKLQSARFNTVLLLGIALYCLSFIFKGIFDSSIDGKELNKKFTSIGTPIYITITTSMFLPVINNSSSIFSDTLVWLLKNWLHFFPHLF
jgi:hypothetical protein